MIGLVGLLGVLLISCTSSSTPTQSQSNANYDAQFREQTRSAQQNYQAGGQMEAAEGDPPVTIMLISMETGNVHPGEDYFVYAVVDEPQERDDLEYVWSVANGDVQEVPESERGRLLALIESEYATGGAPVAQPTGEAGAVGTGAGAGAAAPPGAAPPSGFQRPGGGSPTTGSTAGGGLPAGGGSPAAEGTEGTTSPEVGRLEVPANPGTGAPPPGAGGAAELTEPGNLKGVREEGAGGEEAEGSASDEEQAETEGVDDGSEEGAEEPGSEDPNPESESASVWERRQVAGPYSAQDDESENTDEEDSTDSDEDAAASDEGAGDEDESSADNPRADAGGPAEVAERISQGATSAGTMSGDAVLAGEPEDFRPLSTQYEQWKEGEGEFRRQPLGPYGDDSETESLESEESFEEYTFVTDEPYSLMSRTSCGPRVCPAKRRST
jgi:hypothetical protein